MRRKQSVTPALVLLVLAVAMAQRVRVAASGDGQTFVAVIDAKGTAVTQLTVNDFLVRLGGEPVSVTGLTRAVGPLGLVVIADVDTDAPVLEVRGAVRKLLNALPQQHPGSMVGLMLRSDAGTVVMRHANEDLARLHEDVSHFVKAEGNAPLIERVVVGAGTLAELPVSRRIIITISSVGDHGGDTFVAPNRIVRRLLDDGVSMWAFDMAGPTWRAASSGEARVMVDAARLSGGRYQAVRPSGLGAAIDRLMTIIGAQYLLTYGSEGGGSQTLGVGVRQDGVTVLAPAWTASAKGREVRYVPRE